MNKVVITVFLFAMLCVPCLTVSAIPANQTNDANKTYIIINPNNQIIVQPPNDTKLEVLVQKLLDKQEPRWTEGDILISSSTIMAFFAFGSWFVIRFENKWRREELVTLMQLVLALIGGIQIFHLLAILKIMDGTFTSGFYSQIILSTIVLLALILVIVGKMTEIENRGEGRKEELVNESVAKLRDKLENEREMRERETAMRLAVERQLDDMRRERNRFMHDFGVE